MATTQEQIKQGTVQGAAERLAALRESQMEEAQAIRDAQNPDQSAEERLAALRESEEPVSVEEEIPVDVPEEPIEEVVPEGEADLFADELGDEVAPQQSPDAPAALSSQGKELFAKADPELQKAVSDRIAAAERDYTHKSQQLAEERQQLEALAQEVLQMKDQWAQRLESVEVSLPEPPDPDWVDINSDSYDPDRFNLEMARYERAKLQVEKTKTERQKMAEEQRKANERQKQQTLQNNAEGILKIFPSWNNQDKFVKGVSSVQDFIAAETGITIDAARNITDPAAIKIAYMAKCYKEAKTKARGQVVVPRTTAPSGKPRNQSATSITQARERLKQTGSADDAVELLKATRNQRR